MGEIYPTVSAAVIPGVARILLPESDQNRTAGRGRSHAMDGIRDLLEVARANGLVPGHLRGLLHVAIGRTISKPDGTKISSGVTWRALAALLKTLRFDPELGREVGADPDTLSPRDRERYWYAVIGLARVDGAEAVADAEKLVAPLAKLDFVVGPPPSGVAGATVPTKGKALAKEKPDKAKSE